MSEETPRVGKRHGRLRRWVVRPLTWALTLALAGLGLALLYLSSTSMAERSRAFAVARLSEALGRPVALGALELGLLPLSLEVFDLEVPGPTPLDPPLARIPHAVVELSLSGFSRPVLTVRRVWLEKPEFYLEIGLDGRLNLPRLQPGGGGGGELVVKLGELAVENGIFRLNELSMPLHVDAEGVEVLARGLPGEGPQSSSAGLEARLSIEKIVTTLADGRPYPAKLSGGVRVTPGRVEILETRLEGLGLAARTSGSYRFEGVEQRLALVTEAHGDMSLLSALGYVEPEELAGDFHFQGELFWNAGTWLLTGKVDSPELKARRHTLTELSADVHGSQQELRFDLVRARYADGVLSGPVRVGLGKRPTPLVIDLSVDGIKARQVLADLGLDLTMLAGRLRGAVSYSLVVSAPFEGTGKAQLELYGAEPGTGVLPLAGNVALAVADGRIRAEAVALHGPDQEVLLRDLSVDLKTGAGSLLFAIASADAGGLAAVLPLVDPGEPLPNWLPAAGRGGIEGSLIWGERGRVEADLRVDLADVEIGGSYAGTLTGQLQLTAKAVESLDLRLERGAARLTVSGRVPFVEGEEQLALTFEAWEWPYSLAKSFVPVELPLDGPLSGRLELLGPADRLSGRLDASLTPARIGGLAASALTGRLRFDSERVSFEEIRLALEAGEVRGRGWLDLAEGNLLDLTFESAGLRLEAEPLAGYLGGNLAGRSSLAARWQGSLREPKIEVTLEVPALALAGRTLGVASLGANLEGEQVALAASLPSLLEARGGGRLVLPSDVQEGSLDLTVELEGREVETLIEAFAGTRLDGLTGSFSGSLGLRGALTRPDVRLKLARLSGSYQGLALANLEPVSAHLSADAVVIDSFYLGNQVALDPANGTEVFVGGEVLLTEGFPLDLHVQGTLPARWLEPFLPNLKLTGTINALGVIRGPAGSLGLDGQADLSDSRLILSGFPHALDDLTAVALIYPDQVVLDKLDARLAGGEVKAAGSFALGAEPFSTYHFQAQVREFSLRYPEGWAIEGSAALVLDPLADGSGSMLAGRAALTRAAYQRELQASLFQLLQGYLRRQPVVMDTVDTALTRTQLAIEIDAPGTLRVNNNVADLRGTAELIVRGNLAKPALQGRVEVERGGTLEFDETEYELERGLLTFSRLDRLDPDVDLVARTQVSEYEVTLKLSGNLEKLTTSFSSEPPLPNLDVLALLATGDRPAAGGVLTSPGGTNPLDGGSVEGLLIGAATGAVTDRVKKLLRFDKLRIDPTAATGGSVNAARLLVGKQISRDLYVTYQQSLSSSDQNLVQAEWRLAPGLVVVLSSVAEKEIGRQFAVDLRWEKRF